MSHKVVVCGAGFLGSNIARQIANAPTTGSLARHVQLSSRNPAPLHAKLEEEVPNDRLPPPVALDITKPHTLTPAFENASVVVSLVGLMHGSPQQFDEIQWHGAENVARAARQVDAKLIHFSAIGADANSHIPYARTKGLAEKSVLEICPNATIIRPSLVFGPEDDFFNRFAKLARFLPFLPVYGGGKALFQPVYVGDLARAVEIIARMNPDIEKQVSGRITEAGGPDVFTSKQLMETVLKYTNRHRPIVSFPFLLGYMQGAVLEKFPTNLFTVTRSQVEQLQKDNIVTEAEGPHRFSFQKLIAEGYNQSPLKSLADILPQYLH
ncbi:NADH dehydrogenase [ubiquinone] 1 alpha subcomplex subunit 9, mitochondrial [Leucoagaricus sp. SymC.cos]|nr:NADH dehydrogenase [ubiquinone] 1 alpha subcomplex subunit 9, mitochondrial [Leucoagaricus sp. SymC.cos]